MKKNGWIKEQKKARVTEHSAHASPSKSLTSRKFRVSLVFIPQAFSVGRSSVSVMLIVPDPNQEWRRLLISALVRARSLSSPPGSQEGKALSSQLPQDQEVPKIKLNMNIQGHFKWRYVSFFFFYFLSSTLSIEKSPWWMILLGQFLISPPAREACSVSQPLACAAALGPEPRSAPSRRRPERAGGQLLPSVLLTRLPLGIFTPLKVELSSPSTFPGEAGKCWSACFPHPFAQSTPHFPGFHLTADVQRARLSPS